LFHLSNFNKIWKLVKVLKYLSKKYGRTPAQIALNWLIMSSPQVIPIPGAKKPEQVIDNVGSVGWRLSFNGWKLLEEASRSIIIDYSVWY